MSRAPDRVFRSSRVVTREGIRPAAVHVRDGAIAAVLDHDDIPNHAQLHDAGDHFLLPGLIDTHVHINDPGREDWEGFESATRAAAGGGITAVVDMPLNSFPPTTTATALERKLAAARGRCSIDVAFWGGLVPGNVGELSALAAAGVRGFKCFLVPSGVDEFPAVGEAELAAALPIIAALELPLLVHAELPGPIAAAASATVDPRSYARYHASRPAAAETAAVELLVRLAGETGAHIHIVHVSAAEVIPLLRDAKSNGVRITAETCPHYLHFAAEQIPDGATEYKCAPPIRDANNREQLWSALVSGELDLIASDHSPCPPALKDPESGAFDRAWGGIASLQFSLAVVWTEARRRGVTIDRVVEWMAAAPARLAGLDGQKGALATGHDADIVIFDPDASWTVEPARLLHRHAVTPYAGERLSGIVRETYLRGELAYSADEVRTEPRGRRLMREGATWILRS